MRRREFIGALGGAAAWPILALAEPSKIARIGFLNLAPASAWAEEVASFQTGLRELGYVEGKNVVIEFRWAETVGQLPELANDLVGMNLDIIVAPASTEVEPVLHATKTIPIVFCQHADPAVVRRRRGTDFASCQRYRPVLWREFRTPHQSSAAGGYR